MLSFTITHNLYESRRCLHLSSCRKRSSCFPPRVQSGRAVWWARRQRKSWSENAGEQKMRHTERVYSPCFAAYGSSSSSISSSGGGRRSGSSTAVRVDELFLHSSTLNAYPLCLSHVLGEVRYCSCVVARFYAATLAAGCHP